MKEQEKVKENLISLKAILGVLVGELTFHEQMLKLSVKNKKELPPSHAEELLHHVDVALKTLGDIKDHLEKGVKKNSRCTEDS